MLTPCRKICVYDSLRELCAGCGRRLEEIESWLDMSEEERAAIMAELPGRLKPQQPAS